MEDILARGTKAVISKDVLQGLLDLLAADYQVLGPTVCDGAIVYDEIARVLDLPAGWTDQQSSYHLHPLFFKYQVGYACAPYKNSSCST